MAKLDDKAAELLAASEELKKLVLKVGADVDRRIKQLEDFIANAGELTAEQEAKLQGVVDGLKESISGLKTIDDKTPEPEPEPPPA